MRCVPYALSVLCPVQPCLSVGRPGLQSVQRQFIGSQAGLSGQPADFVLCVSAQEIKAVRYVIRRNRTACQPGSHGSSVMGANMVRKAPSGMMKRRP